MRDGYGDEGVGVTGSFFGGFGLKCLTSFFV